MELVIRAHAGLKAPVDVMVVVEPTHTVADLAQALAGFLQLGVPRPTLTLSRRGVPLDPTAMVTATELLSGDDVLVGVAATTGPVLPIPVRAVTVDIVAGPESGNSIIVPQGTFTIGRERSMAIMIDDATVSRHHLDVIVGADWATTIVPQPDVENAPTVNGVPITAATQVSGDDVVGLGSTGIAFRPFVRSSSDTVDQLGQIEFLRTPYRPPVVSERTVDEIAPVPTRPEPRRFQILSVIGPLVAGLTMYAFTRQIQFLALTLLSPVALVANWFEERRSGKSRFGRELAAFSARVEDRRRQLAAAVEDERVERVRSAPEIAGLARRAELRTVDLWSRGRQAPDLLRLRVGVGTVPTLVTVPVERTADEEFRSMLQSASVIADQLHGVPISVDLREHPVAALYGAESAVSGLASALLIQVACLHSPEDITIAAAVSVASPIASWMKWLPHTRSVTSPLAGEHVVTTTDAANELINRVQEVVDFRMASPSQDRADRCWPRIVLVLDSSLRLDPVVLSQLLDSVSTAGVSVLWMAEAEAELPRQASAIVSCAADAAGPRGRLWFTDPTLDAHDVQLEQIRPAIADRTARALAPVRDASAASLATSIPRTAPLLDVIGADAIDAASVRARWAAAVDYSLRFPVGIGADGVFSLDLVEDGPHALIGGTSGAGKSELLQSIVTSLAVHHPPNRLNFLFVDYKGGAASDVFAPLPHTVGAVTNLSAELSLRALTSLRAELNRRMRVLQEHEAKDLREMLEHAPAAAPPSLVIVVDEFATLVKEVPEFVAGIVDIAQRGRSLGIHLILATQRPSGSVNDNILANTNLRISLRMLDRGESTAVINSPEAADIPVPLRGRGFARLGPRTLVAFQSAYCSAPLTSDAAITPVMVGVFDNSGASPKAPAAGAAGMSQMDAVLAAIVSANETLHTPAPRRPWRDVLPELVTLDEVLADERCRPAFELPGRMVAIGMVDAPEEQDQYPLLIDLEQGGGCAVYGSGGAGKTSFLRTLAVSASRCASGDEVAIIGIDFASRGLTSIGVLPQVVEVATGDDLEAVTRLIAVLDLELGRRRVLLGDARAENLTAYNQAATAPLPRILVLVDHLGALLSAFSGASGGLSLAVPLETWAERLLKVLADGRQVGIHVVVTADRRPAVPARTQAAIANRVILRHADESGYSDHGISTQRAKGLTLAPGTGLWQANLLMQVASVGSDHSGSGQAAAIAEYAARTHATLPRELRTAPLGERLVAAELEPAATSWSIPLGRTDIAGDTSFVDLTRSHFLVTGLSGSGRSTALVRCVQGLTDTHVWQISSATSPLADLPSAHKAVGAAAAVSLLEQLQAVAAVGAGAGRHVLVVDDVDTFEDPTMNSLIEVLMKSDVVRLVGSMESRSLSGYTPNMVINELRRARRVLLLQPGDANEVMQAFGVKAPLRPGMSMPVGRGVLLEGRLASIVQVAV